MAEFDGWDARQADLLKNRNPTTFPSYAGCRATVFVHPDAPQYATLKAWSISKEADPRDWRLDQQRDGLWVALNVVQNIGQTARAAAWKPVSDADVRASLERTAKLKRTSLDDEASA